MSEDYYSHSRPEVRALLPEGLRFVVDVGCGAGAVGAAIKTGRPGVEVRGIEPSVEAASRAARVLDDVAVMGADGAMPAGWPAPDCVLFADVLEHLVDPWSTLRTWRERLRDGAWVIVSLPNVGYVSVTRELCRGRWDYEEEGVLDRTHLRFFTRSTAVEMLEAAGFRVDHLFRAIRVPSGTPGRSLQEGLAVLAFQRELRGGWLPAGLVRWLDSCSRQFVLRARVGAPDRAPRRD